MIEINLRRKDVLVHYPNKGLGLKRSFFYNTMEYSNADPMEILSRDECHEIIAKYLKSANFILQNYRIERINDAGVIGFMGEYYWLIICITLVNWC